MSLSREEIIRMARECSDVIKDSRGREAFEFDEYGLEHLANAAYAAGAAAEREACAQIGEAFDKERPQSNYGRCIAVAIRARGNGGGK